MRLRWTLGFITRGFGLGVCVVFMFWDCGCGCFDGFLGLVNDFILCIVALFGLLFEVFCT